jgi:hypothetical protein
LQVDILILGAVANSTTWCRFLETNRTSEIHQPDRRALDEVVFDVLGLTAGEREAVYEAVVNLVRARLEKARSV